MRSLASLAAAVPGTNVQAGPDVQIRRVISDSRQAEPGDLFVAIPGLRTDGIRFANEAAARGAAIAASRPVPLPEGTAWVRVDDPRTALARLAAALHGFPAARMRVVGITGTDGKTTTTHLTAHLLERSGRRAGVLSTIAFGVGEQELPNSSGLTTVEAPVVQERLGEMVDAGATHAILEVTSHALAQGRTIGCEFDVAAFTNVGHDHLDYHRTWAEYLGAKALLIDECRAALDKGMEKTAVLNRDDPSYEMLASRPIGRHLVYGSRSDADVQAIELSLHDRGSRFRLRTPAGVVAAELPMPGSFNVANALCAAAICVALGLSPNEIADGLGCFPGVPGRLERVSAGQPFEVYVDYAHSAGALRNVLAVVRRLSQRRVFAVFGATARSDHDRPGMGAAAAAGSDFFIITTDDPLDQDPAILAEDVLRGAPDSQTGRDHEIILDRREAIRRAFSLAQPGDVVLLAGKGHERVMRGRSDEPWDDRVEAKAALRELGFGD